MPGECHFTGVCRVTAGRPPKAREIGDWSQQEIPAPGCLCVLAPGQRSCVCLGVSTLAKQIQLLFKSE